MTEVTTRNEERERIAAGGWTIYWGDLLNEGDLLDLARDVGSGMPAKWVAEQIEAQVKKFGQSMSGVSDDIINEATKYVKELLRGRRSGERAFNGLHVKAGMATYHRKMKSRLGSFKLPNNFQPYIGVRVAKNSASPEGLFDAKLWYKLKPQSSPGMAVDVVNDGNQKRDGRVQIATEGNFSGQLWQIRPSKTSPGAYNLCTMWLGTGMCLDVYGDDKTRPHLATAGNYSGQQWHIENQGNSTWKLTNSYSGPDLALTADANGSELHLKSPLTSAVSPWILQPGNPITESGFDL